MEIIYEPKGKAKEYASLAVNLYEGCDHGCTYCFGPATLKRDREKFHASTHPKKDALQRLSRDAEKLRIAGDDREILLSFVTDPYQTIESETKLTQEAIKILKQNNLRFTILTKGGLRAVRDFDLLAGYDKASFGSTLIFTNEADANKWEPNAPKVDLRIEAIKEANNRGIRTWVSLEPVICPDQAKWPTPETVHNWLVKATDGHTNEKPIDKKTCVRVVYAGQYHVDLPAYAEFLSDYLLGFATK